MNYLRLRKVIGVIGTLILLFPILLGFWGVTEVEAAEDIPTQKVTLHKRALLEDERPENGIVNDGNIKTDFPGKPLPDVTFTAYNVTSIYHDYREAGDSVEEAFSKLKSVAVESLLGVSFSPTDATGKTSLDLPTATLIDGKKVNSVYVIKETGAPSSVIRADDIVIALPFYEEDSTTKMDEVNLYPKNYQVKKTLEFTKYGVDSDGQNEEVLAGAIFVLKNSDGDYLNVTPLASGLPDFSGEDALAETTRQFTTDEEGRVIVSDLALEIGTYTFEEISSVEPYHATNKSYVVATVEPDGAISYVYYDEQGEEITANGDAKVYNYDVPTPEKTVDDQDADIDQVLNYKATLKIPVDAASYTKFDLVDLPDERLELLSELGSLKATIAGTDIELATVPTVEGENGFRFSFYETLADKETIIANVGKTIEINFQMTIKEGALIDTPITNELIFENNFRDSNDTEEVQTHGKKFIKVDAYKRLTKGEPNPIEPLMLYNRSEGSDLLNKARLAGAEFLVIRETNEVVEYRTYDKETGSYGWSTNREDTNRVVLVSGENGEFEIIGLATGNYKLEEIKAPEGYQLPVDPFFEFVVTETSYTDAAQILAIPNSENGILPSTGGMGIVGFLAVGIVAILSGSIYFYQRRRIA